MKPKIGVTCGEVKNIEEPWAPVVYGQMHTYTDAIIHAGGTPFILPFVEDEAALRELYNMCDGLLIAGGNDVGPERYGEEPLPETVEVSPKRDAQEIQLLTWAIADKKPILAICRGMQILNVARGGSLYQDIVKQVPGANDHTESTKKQSRHHLAHSIKLAKDSILSEVTARTRLDTNTHHHQAVKNLGAGVRVVGRAEDGVAEAIEIPGLPFVVGVQSHPESLEETMPEWAAVFRAFIDAAT